MDSLKISVIIPTYNRVSSIKKTIESVLNQNSEQWELIVIDDGSTDETHRTLAEHKDDERIMYFFQKNAGVSAARNHGAAKASGRWLVFLDSDDELTQTALSVFEEQIQRKPEVDLFVAGRDRKTSTGSEVRIPKEGVYSAMLSGTFCLRSSIFQKVGGYDPRFRFAENTELFHRIGQLEITRCFIPEVSLIYHDSTSGGSKNTENIINSVSLFLSKHQDSMSYHHRHLYHQIVGVNLLRNRRFEEARKHLWKAYQLKPTQLKTFVRLVVSFLPSLAKKIYSNHSAT